MKATEAKLMSFLQKSPQFIIPIYQRTYSWTGLIVVWWRNCDSNFRISNTRMKILHTCNAVANGNNRPFL